MTNLLAISGSLRLDSFNTRLAHAIKANAPGGVNVDVIGIVGIPLYNQDIEDAGGIPETVETFKSKIKAADGVILCTPEYNSSIPGVFKNALDWATRPPKDMGAIFGGKSFALVGATPGSLGTVMSQAAWLPVLRALGARLWTGQQLRVGGAGNVFDENGHITDDKTRERLAKFVSGFAESI